MSTHNYSVGAWSQDQRNMTIAMACRLLHAAGITVASYGVTVSGSTLTLTLTNPSSDPTATVSQAAMESAYLSWQAEAAAAQAAYDTEAGEIDTAAAAAFKGTSLTSVLATLDANITAIQAAGNVAQLRAAMVDLANYHRRHTVVTFAMLKRLTGELRP